MKKVSKKESCRSLSIYEQNVLLPIMMKGLVMKKGKVNAVTRKQIIDGIRGQGLTFSRINLVRIIHHIRTHDLIEGLVGSTTGYYVTSSEQDLKDYEINLMGREASIRKMRLTIQRQRRSMFAQAPETQTQLF